MSSKPDPTIWSLDTGHRIPCFDRCQLTITWMSNIKLVRCKPRLGIRWIMAAILHDVVGRKKPGLTFCSLPPSSIWSLPSSSFSSLPSSMSWSLSFSSSWPLPSSSSWSRWCLPHRYNRCPFVVPIVALLIVWMAAPLDILITLFFNILITAFLNVFNSHFSTSFTTSYSHRNDRWFPYRFHCDTAHTEFNNNNNLITKRLTYNASKEIWLKQKIGNITQKN